ncbi:hypothetical protein DVH24_010683 [Malus domestica]|uniref:Uncharacterized protein n=1 Tax=Malus domestica TaxID=3750 RepID=A0A498JRF3_MALDO|nr:hypothetical protein DVH24_010683 [Malus domestica]
MDHINLICIFSSLPSMRPFKSSLASDSIGTSKLSEFVREQFHDGSRVSYQKQNRKSVVGTQSEQYSAKVKSSSECDRDPNQDVT